jgi:hypothetical protein
MARKLQAACRLQRKKKRAPMGPAFRLQRRRYLLVPELELPLVLGELLLGELVLGELLLGELLLPLVLGELLLGEVLLPVAPPVAPLEPALEPDLLKYASHSCFETCPSLFLSTDVKLGVLMLPAPLAPAEPLLVPPAELLVLGELLLELGEELAPDELLPVALGELELELLGELELELLGALELPPDADEPLEDLSDEVALGLELLPEELELCAMATLDRAKSAAAVAALMSFRFIRILPPLSTGSRRAAAAAARRRSADRCAAVGRQGAARRRRTCAGSYRSPFPPAPAQRRWRRLLRSSLHCR